MALAKSGDALIDEMSIVDIFTRLIFDADSDLGDTEILVIEELAQIDHSLVQASRRDVSDYLSSMGVNEMIKLVAQIKRHIDCQQDLIAANQSSQRHPLYR
ncbi:MAG: hypothetical protein V3T17_11085 [Pseudomonadales bacterium]